MLLFYLSLSQELSSGRLRTGKMAVEFLVTSKDCFLIEFTLPLVVASPSYIALINYHCRKLTDSLTLAARSSNEAWLLNPT